MPDNQGKQNQRAGIDQAGESERRYKDIPIAGRADQNIKERETEYQERNVEKQRVSDIEAPLGYGSKTEGAFGKEHENLDEKMNARYRSREADKNKKSND